MFKNSCEKTTNDTTQKRTFTSTETSQPSLLVCTFDNARVVCVENIRLLSDCETDYM